MFANLSASLFNPDEGVLRSIVDAFTTLVGDILGLF